MALTCEQRRTAFLNTLINLERLNNFYKLEIDEMKEKLQRIKDIVCSFPVGDCCGPVSETLAAMVNAADLYSLAQAAVAEARTAAQALSCSAQNWTCSAYGVWELVESAQLAGAALEQQWKTFKGYYKTIADAGCELVIRPDAEGQGEG